jgi:uncharacterized protein
MSAIDNGTVVVTGASSGIGMEIARLVAPRAKALVLVARRTDRLDALKKELEQKCKDVRIETIKCDLSNREDTERLIAEIAARELDVDVLVNNAGVGLMGVVDRADVKRTVAMIDLNCTSLTMLTMAFLPAMVKRGRGGILNISSGFGMGVLPSFAAYCATKHFVTAFTEGMVADLVGTGVVVTQICPGPVATEFEQNVGNFTGQKVPGFIEISAEHCAKVAIRSFDRKRALVVPGLIMKIVMLINEWSPRFLRRLFAMIVGGVARKKELAATTRLRE